MLAWLGKYSGNFIQRLLRDIRDKSISPIYLYTECLYGVAIVPSFHPQNHILILLFHVFISPTTTVMVAIITLAGIFHDV